MFWSYFDCLVEIFDFYDSVADSLRSKWLILGDSRAYGSMFGIFPAFAFDARGDGPPVLAP